MAIFTKVIYFYWKSFWKANSKKMHLFSFALSWFNIKGIFATTAPFPARRNKLDLKNCFDLSKIMKKTNLRMKTQWREFEGKVANYLQSFVLLYFKAFFSIKNEKLNFKRDELKPYVLVSKNFLNLEQRKRKLNFYLASSNLCSKIQWLIKVNCSNFIVITYLFFNCNIMVHTQKKISVGLKNYFYKSSMLMFVRSWDNLAKVHIIL